jgi:hypothetical protein
MAQPERRRRREQQRHRPQQQQHERCGAVALEPALAQALPAAERAGGVHRAPQRCAGGGAAEVVQAVL